MSGRKKIVSYVKGIDSHSWEGIPCIERMSPSSPMEVDPTSMGSPHLRGKTHISDPSRCINLTNKSDRKIMTKKKSLGLKITMLFYVVHVRANLGYSHLRTEFKAGPHVSET